MRRKKTKRQKLYEKLDRIVSEIVIKRDKRCVICNAKRKLGNGHIFSRRHLATRWDVAPDGNCHCQCWSCNFRHIRDQYDYFNWYIEKFGKKKFDALRKRHKQTIKMKTKDLEQLYAKLKSIRGSC
jgi:Skp family chaperone for outer membrane proteins